MESVGSNTLETPFVGGGGRQIAHRIADRIVRSLRHRISLLHRPSAATFHVLGATGNVYTVDLAPGSSTPRCTCPDRTTPCKHILFVLIRALGVSPDDPCLRRRSLRPCYLDRLISYPARPDCLATPSLRNLFHQLFESPPSSSRDTTVRNQTENEALLLPTSSSKGKLVINQAEYQTSTCPICLEEIIVRSHGDDGGRERTERWMTCRVCKNAVHEACMVTWKKSRGRRPASCVICRARWPAGRINSRPYQDKYLNLSAYIDGDDTANQMVNSDRCGG